MYSSSLLSRGILLVFLFIFCFVPGTSVQAQGTSGSGSGGEIQPTGEVGFEEANQEAIRKLNLMSADEIKSLDQKLAEALVLYYDRGFARALPIFKEIASKVETMDVMFWVGTSAMNVGETQLAIQKFKKMLDIDPKLHRVRLELATAYFTTGHYDEARRELELVQAAPLPSGVRENVAKLLEAIEERTRKVFWNLRVSQGFSWDDNISSGPDQNEIAVLGGTLTLDKESSKLRDEAAVTNLAGNVLYDFGKRNGLMWNTTASLYNVAYFDYSQFNYMAADVTTGPWWGGRSDVVKIPCGYTEQEYGNDRLSYIIHVDPNYEHYFNQYFSLKGLYSYINTDYYSTINSVLDNEKHRLELTPNIYLANRKHVLSTAAGYEESNADASTYSYDGPYYAFSYFTSFPTSTEFFLRYQWTQRDYDGKPLLCDKYRKDKRHSFTAVLSQGFLKYLFASFSFTYMDNDSNCELYDFDRTTYTISVGGRF